MTKINKNLENWFYEKIKNVKNREYEELEQVTIVIASYERQDYLLRQFIYWNGSGVKLLILDGSHFSLPQAILDVILSWEDVTYLHLPISIEARLNEAVDYINTPYVASLSDDDLFLKGALKNLVIELDENSGLSGCIGQSVRFTFDQDQKKINYGHGYPHWDYLATQDSIKERLAYAMNAYNAATAYGLFRKDIWIDGWGDIKQYSCVYTSEIYQALVTYISGKYKALDELYWLRSEENVPVETYNWNRKLRFHEWFRDGKYQIEKEQFLSNLEEVTIKQQQVDKENAKRIVLSAINVYLEFNDRRLRKRKSLKKRMKKLFSRLLNVISPKRIFQYMRDKLKVMKAVPLCENAKYPWLCFTKSNNIEENQKEMKEIEILLKEFYDFR